MSADGFVSKSLWESAALSYAGFAVTRIEITSFENTEFHFEGAASLDAQGIIDDYQNGCLALSDAKSYSMAFTKLNALVRDLKKRGESSWQAVEFHKPDQHNEAYWKKVRENVEARRRERESRDNRDARSKRLVGGEDVRKISGVYPPSSAAHPERQP